MQQLQFVLYFTWFNPLQQNLYKSTYDYVCYLSVLVAAGLRFSLPFIKSTCNFDKVYVFVSECRSSF